MAQRAKAAVMSIASSEKQKMVEKLWGKQPASGGLLAYASADASVTGSIIDTRSQNPMMGGAPPYDRQTAVYDIAAKTVYLPDGTTLEAHSGLGSKMDDVRYSHVPDAGVTPPHIYELKPREALFHGVPALRLTPLGGEEKIHGRDGLLAHSYMLGPTRSVQRLRLVQGLLRVPRRLQEQGHPPPRGAGEGAVERGRQRCRAQTVRCQFPRNNRTRPSVPCQRVRSERPYRLTGFGAGIQCAAAIVF